MLRSLPWLSAAFFALSLGACSDDAPAPSEPPGSRSFRLTFRAEADGQPVGCTSEIGGLGADASTRVGLSDLRFYVSNLRLWDENGTEVAATLDENEFQYRHGAEHVTLIDLTSNTEGTCAQTAIALAEGTARTHDAVTGTTVVDRVKRVTFDVGVPQAMMKQVIHGGAVEGAPSPLNEMYWSWATGYRHLVLNVAVTSPQGKGDGYLHIGSRDCSPQGGLALDDRDRCAFLNTPRVSLALDSLDQRVIALDLRQIFQSLPFRVEGMDHTTHEPTAGSVGAACHSSPTQPDCAMVFPRLGLDLATGEATPEANALFVVKLAAMHPGRLLAIALLGAAPAACSEPAPGAPSPPTAAQVRQRLGLPPHFQLPDIPADNPLTDEKIALGRRLFYDRQLSANGTQSCADCHHQERAFAEDRATAVGSTGTVLVRNSQGLANVAYAPSLTWASNNLLTLELQLHVPLTNDQPIELGVTDSVQAEVMQRFDQGTIYPPLFRDAFPGTEPGATLPKVILALASFCRTMISGQSPYDRFLQGDRSALTEQQKLGFSLFTGERFECFHCHEGTQLTSAYHDASQPARELKFFNNGLYNVDGQGSYPAHDQGLFDLTFNPAHRGLFRPPSLRNVALTAPYMHDGSIPTLRAVVEHYAAGGRNLQDGPFAGDGRISPLKSGLVRGFTASDEEIDALVAFLESLTDTAFVTSPALSNPWLAPSP